LPSALLAEDAGLLRLLRLEELAGPDLGEGVTGYGE
jgi:hypothetical protein